MKRIPIVNRDHYALVDDDDFTELSKYKWFDMAGYAVRQVYEKGSGRNNRKVRTVRMHRLIMGLPNGKEVDHIDGNRCNNQKSNLRVCSRSQNAQNGKIRKDNTHGYTGVYWRDTVKSYGVRAQKNGKTHHVGFFKHLDEAIGASYGYRLEIFGEYARDL